MNLNRRDEILNRAYRGKSSDNGPMANSVAAEKRLNELLDQIPELTANPDALSDFRMALYSGDDSVIDLAPVTGRPWFKLRFVEAGLVAAAALVIGLVLFGLPGSNQPDSQDSTVAQGWTYRTPYTNESKPADESELAGLPFDDPSFCDLVAAADRLDQFGVDGDQDSPNGLDDEDWAAVIRSLEY